MTSFRARPVISILPELENETSPPSPERPHNSLEPFLAVGRGADPIWLLISIQLARARKSKSVGMIFEGREEMKSLAEYLSKLSKHRFSPFVPWVFNK